MAATLRVLLFARFGNRWQEASEEAKAEAWKRMRALDQEWKKDPGIRFVSYYNRRGPDSARNFLFEIDNVNTFHEKMASPFWEANLPFEESYLELVTGDTEFDEFWTS